MFLNEVERLETVRACRDCPMCHHVDAATLITGREANTSRGRAMLLWGLEKGLLRWESEGVANILYQAFVDGLAQEWCEGNYDIDELVIQGRRSLVDRGLAPTEVAAVAAHLHATGNPYGRSEQSLGALVERSGGQVSDTPQVALFFGSTARLMASQSAIALIRILHELAIPFAVFEGETDSGFLSYQMGDYNAAAAQARKTAALLSGTQAKTLVVLGAGDYRMFTTRYARLQAPLSPALQVLHVTEFLSQLLQEQKLAPRKKLDTKVTYHDPSSLARFTYVIDPPRRVLSALAGPNYVEMEFGGRKSHTCGETGGVSITYPELAVTAAKLRIDQARLTGAKILACADPDCEVLLRQVGAPDMEIKDITELLADTL
jgi:heterodisulfide reductase subunit D